MQFDCDSCQSKYDSTTAIKCVVCNTYFHLICVDSTLTDSRSLRSKKNEKWTCNTCNPKPIVTENNNDINELKQLILTLQAKIDSLEKSLVANNKSKLEQCIEFEDIIKEINDRKYRENNIIIHGLPETSTPEAELVPEVISAITPDINKNEFSFKRLGKINNLNKPRIVKVSFNNSRNVKEIFKNIKKLKNNTKFSKISITNDKTPRQREHLALLKDELKNLNSAGEKNYVIKYVSGVPTIIKSKN